MADRFAFQFTKSLVPEMFILDGYVSIGAAGALSPTLVTTASIQNGTSSTLQTLPFWMKSITQGATNAYQYTVVLTDTWANKVQPSITVVGANALSNITASILSCSTSGFVFETITASTGSDGYVPNGGGLIFKLNVSNMVSR